MENLKRRLNLLPAWILTLIVVGIILWLTLAPHPLGDEEIPMFPGADKVVHGCMFGFLTFVSLVDWARGRNFRMVRWPVCLVAASLSTLFGIAIEFIQRAMEQGRSFDVYDMLADGIGAYAVALIWIIAEHIRGKIRTS